MLDYDFGRGGLWPAACLFKAFGPRCRAGRRYSGQDPAFTPKLTPGAERQPLKADAWQPALWSPEGDSKMPGSPINTDTKKQS